MYAKRAFFKINHQNPSVQHYTVLNIWCPTRNINLLQKCKDCLNTLLKSPGAKEQPCKVSESCCTTRAPLEEATLSPSANHDVTTQRSPRVVIIGAGMAGLSAANHLQDNGLTNLTVLEAQDRPGGRIYSQWFGDSVIELGYPVEKDFAFNPIVQTAIEDGFTSYRLNNADQSRGLLLRSDGSVVPYPLTFEVYQIFKQIWQDVHEIEYKESGTGNQSPRTLLGSIIEQEARMFPSNYQVDAERIFHGLASLALSKSNHDSSLILSTNFGDYMQLPGSRIKVPLGHFGEINTLYEALPPDQVIFKKAVSKIRWGGVPGVFPRALVICEDGDTFQADFVIITIPLGVLKDLADTLFCPGLPAFKLDAILKIPTGLSNKVFVEFTVPFWMWKKDFKKISYDPKDMACQKSWLKGVCCIEPLQGSNHIACVTVAGAEAQSMESLPDEEIKNGIMSLLEESSPGKKVPMISKIRRSSWCNNPRFYGTYSFKGQQVSSKDFYSLATPLPEQSEYCEPVLLFAGEATCPVQFGSVAGARNSGVREAERLLQLVRLQSEAELTVDELCKVHN